MTSTYLLYPDKVKHIASLLQNKLSKLDGPKRLSEMVALVKYSVFFVSLVAWFSIPFQKYRTKRCNKTFLSALRISQVPYKVRIQFLVIVAASSTIKPKSGAF